MRSREEISLEILGESYSEYEKERDFLVRVSTELDELSGHSDVFTDNTAKCHKTNNRKAKAKLRRLLDEQKNLKEVEKTLKLKHKENK